MALEDRLTRGPDTPTAPKKAKRKHPSGWEPRVEETNNKASVITPPRSDDPDHRTLLVDSGLDPDQWTITSEIQVRRWQQTEDGPWLRYFRFSCERAGAFADPGWDEAIARLAKHKPKAPPKKIGDFSRVVCLSDWQAGKSEGGGSIVLAERIERLIDDVVAMVKREKPEVLYLAGLGDMVEGCDGHYAMQTFSIDMDRRQQVRFVRRALLALVKAVAPHCRRVVMLCVPGNHGENRKDGKAYTSFGDNDDVAVFEMVADVCAESDAFSNVHFIIPDDDLTVTVDMHGTIVGFAHGHQFGKGTGPANKATEWWKGQALGRHPVGEADCLVSGHYHHFHAMNSHGRTWLQCPALDGGSKWFTDVSGAHDIPGTLTFRVDKNGVSSIEILRSQT